MAGISTWPVPAAKPVVVVGDGRVSEGEGVGLVRSSLRKAVCAEESMMATSIQPAGAVQR